MLWNRFVMCSIIPKPNRLKISYLSDCKPIPSEDKTNIYEKPNKINTNSITMYCYAMDRYGSKKQ